MSLSELASAVRLHGYDVEPEPARIIENGDRVARVHAAVQTSTSELVIRLRVAH